MSSEKTPDYSFKTEIFRKSIHLNALFIILIYEFYGKQIILYFLIIFLAASLGLEYLRLEHGMKIPFNSTLRYKEKKVIGGYVFFQIGAILAISVFSKEIAILSILMATFGDISAALFGRAYGKHFITGLKNKASEGVTAEFIVDLLVGFSYLYLFVNINPLWLFVLVTMAVVATATETLSGKIDDNLIVPIYAGIVGEFLVLILLL